nr:reverse transcriptase domain-containing protein [Tanacetum cinerariifolium]
MWKVFVVPRLSWRRKKRCGNFKDQEMDCGACKKLVRWVRVLDMQDTLHDKIIVMQVTLHYEAIVLHDKRIVMKVTLHYEAIMRLQKLSCWEFHCQGNVVPTEKQILQICEALFLGRPISFQNQCGSSHLKGIDFMGLFPSSRRNKYILVAVDYLSKWVEAKALPTNDARVVCKFLKNLFARFETPRAIISDQGMHFSNDQFAKVMPKKACHLPIELEHKAY